MVAEGKAMNPSLTDRLNPILVREARIMVRSRWIVLAIVVYQLILIWAVAFVVMIGLAEGRKSEEAAQTLYWWISNITWNVTVITVVVYTGWRMAADRINEDLLFCTTITPAQNIRGRLACGFVLSVLFYSMSAPYLSVTYLLRGIDLWPFLLWLPVALLKITILNLVAIAVFSAARSWIQFFFYALLFLLLAEPLQNLSVLAPLLILHPSVLTHGIHWQLSIFGYPFTRIPLQNEILLALSVLSGVLYFIVPVTAFLFARCNLSPYSSNRMMPIRRWLSWLLGVSFTFIFIAELWQRNLSGVFNYIPFLSVWMIFAIGVLSSMLVLSVCERETWEGRLRRSIPKSRLRRALVFPLFTGSINGLLWVFLWTFWLAVVNSILVLKSLNFQGTLVVNGYNPENLLFPFRHLVFLMLVFDYSITAFFLWKVLLYRQIPREMIWTVTLGLMIAVATTCSLSAFFVQDTFHVTDNPMLLAPNPVSVYMADDFGYQLVFGLGWFCTIILFGYPWLRNRFLDFTPESG